MTARSHGSWVSLVLLLAALSGCGGEDDEGGDKPPPVAGTYVGPVEGTKAFVAVVAAPEREGQERRSVTVFVCDGRRLCELSSGSISGDAFTAAPEGGGAEAKGKLSGKAASGTIKLPDGKTVRYSAQPAAAAAGLYDLKVSSDGKFSGASAAGVALKGTSTLPKPGEGTLTLADGEKLEFETSRAPAARVPLRPGQVRVIVLPDGKLAGVGKTADDGASTFVMRSAG